MSRIPVELPADLQEFIDAKVQQGQFASANDYIVALVNAARHKRSEIEAALLSGLDSSPVEAWPSHDWADMKRRVIERHGNK